MILHPVRVDQREKEAALYRDLLLERGIPAKVGLLPSPGGGDFRWLVEPETEGQSWFSVTVERKSIADLLSSSNDGRLATFTDTPSTAAALRVLLIHGDAAIDRQWGRFDGDEMSADAIDNLAVSVQTDGIVVVRANRGAAALADRLASLYHWSGKDEHGSYRQPERLATSQAYLDPREREAVRFLMGIPGMGEGRARALQSEYGVAGVMRRLISATDLSDLESVRGIGKGTIKKAVEFLSQDS